MRRGRRLLRRPVVAVPVAIGLLAVVVVAMEGDWVLLPGTVAAFFVGRHLSRPAGIAATAALLAAGLAADARAGTVEESLVPTVMLPLTLWLAGAALREHDLVTRRLRQRAEELEAEREAFASLSVRYERARIAAELHDVVAHAISVMVVQASAGQRLAATSPGSADATFRVIGDAARQAEMDLGRLAKLLAADAASGPAGDLALVEQLVDRAAASGLTVTLRLVGDQEALRGPAAHVASRVVQEGLTNALRYAPGAPIRVLVRAEPAAVAIEVVIAAPPPGGRALGLGSGRGLTGLRERVEAVGGGLDAGAEDGGWALRVRLPHGVPAAVP